MLIFDVTRVHINAAVAVASGSKSQNHHVEELASRLATKMEKLFVGKFKIILFLLS